MVAYIPFGVVGGSETLAGRVSARLGGEAETQIEITAPVATANGKRSSSGSRNASRGRRGSSKCNRGREMPSHGA